MKDEELLARKKRLSAILLHRLNRHFYPLACRSFSLDTLSIDQAFAGVAAGLSARDRSMVVRMYVHFRLALAEMFLETEAEGSSFLSLTLAGKLSLDVTGQFSEAFPKVRDGLSYFFSSTGKPETGILPLVSLLSLETGLSLSPYVDFFRKETLSYIDRMQRDGTDFLAALSFCDPEYHAGDTRLPAFLCLALGEAEGRALAAQVFESAQMLGTLEQCLSPLYPLKDAARARFLYAYMRFRAHVFSFFVSYLRQERAMRPAIPKRGADFALLCTLGASDADAGISFGQGSRGVAAFLSQGEYVPSPVGDLRSEAATVLLSLFPQFHALDHGSDGSGGF